MPEESVAEGLLGRLEEGEAVGDVLRADIEWRDVRFLESRIVVGGYYRDRKESRLTFKNIMLIYKGSSDDGFGARETSFIRGWRLTVLFRA
jgi:hypothetical protein